jgi:hypothetical protein
VEERLYDDRTPVHDARMYNCETSMSAIPSHPPVMSSGLREQVQAYQLRQVTWKSAIATGCSTDTMMPAFGRRAMSVFDGPAGRELPE